MQKTLSTIVNERTKVELGAVCGTLGFMLGIVWMASAANSELKSVKEMALETKVEFRVYKDESTKEIGKVNVTLERILTVLETTGGADGKDQKTSNSGR